MFVNMETKRLLLKCVDPGDREFIFEEFQNDFINQYLYDQEPMTEIEEADELIEFYTIEEPRNQNRWVLINKLDNQKMGTCGFHLWDRKANKVELGFELMQPFNGKGYMTEAVEAIINFAHHEMKVNIITAVVYIENSACKRLLEKLGFSIVGQEECIFIGNMYLHHQYELELLHS